MHIALLYYDGFSEFETVISALLFKRHNLTALALENREYRSEENQRYCYDQLVRDADPDSIDLLVIPGGDPALLVDNQELKLFIEALLARNKKVAGICGGAAVLAGQGFLNGKKCTGLASGVKPGSPYAPYFADSILVDDPVAVDGNIITAQGQAYVEFAAALALQMGLYSSQADCDEDIRWFKNIR